MKIKLLLSYVVVAALGFGAGGWTLTIVAGSTDRCAAELERGEAHVHTWGPFGNGTNYYTAWASYMVQYRACLKCGVMERREIKDAR